MKRPGIVRPSNVVGWLKKRQGAGEKSPRCVPISSIMRSEPLRAAQANVFPGRCRHGPECKKCDSPNCAASAKPDEPRFSIGEEIGKGATGPANTPVG